MHELIYAFDPYCGWCYGFGPAVRELASDPDISVTVVSGSLFTGDRSRPISTYPHIPAANKRISELTGVTFGPAYESLLAEGGLVLDSEAASQGLVALKTAAGPGRDLEMSGAMQTAFYQDGLSLSDPETYRLIADKHGLDTDTVLSLLSQQQIHDTAAAEREKLQSWGIESYPTLLLVGPNSLTKIGSPTTSAQQLRARINEYQ